VKFVPRSGFAELGLPVFDPLLINKIGIDQGGNGPVVLKLDMITTNVFGFSGVRYKSIKGLGKNFDRAKIDIKYSQPLFQMIGKYKANGKVLVLPVQGELIKILLQERPNVIQQI
jgi:hypothetical protein